MLKKEADLLKKYRKLNEPCLDTRDFEEQSTLTVDDFILFISLLGFLALIGLYFI